MQTSIGKAISRSDSTAWAERTVESNGPAGRSAVCPHSAIKSTEAVELSKPTRDIRRKNAREPRRNTRRIHVSALRPNKRIQQTAYWLDSSSVYLLCNYSVHCLPFSHIFTSPASLVDDFNYPNLASVSVCERLIANESNGNPRRYKFLDCFSYSSFVLEWFPWSRRMEFSDIGDQRLLSPR